MIYAQQAITEFVSKVINMVEDTRSLFHWILDGLSDDAQSS